MTVPEEDVRIPTGDLLLDGRLARAAHTRRAAVVCHPHPQYGGTMDNNVVEAVTGALQRTGYATLRFNFRGVGESQGSYGNGIGELEDAGAAVRFLAERVGCQKVTLAGYSFGAAIALQVGHEDPLVDCLIAVAPPLSMFDLGFLRSCTKPKLFLVGDRDSYCPLEIFERNVALLAAPTTSERLAGADHFFAGHEGRLAEHVARFAEQSSAC